MKVVFLYHYYDRKIKDKRRVEFPPLGMLYICAIFEKMGFEVEVLYFNKDTPSECFPEAYIYAYSISATEMIDVTGYSLRGFFQSYRSEIINKIEKNPNFKLRILLVDPRSIFSKEKEKEKNGEYRGVFHANICTLYGYFKNYSSNIEIKLIPSGLSSMIFRIDDKMFIGPYMYKRDSKSTVTFEVTVEGWMFRQYIY